MCKYVLFNILRHWPDLLNDITTYILLLYFPVNFSGPWQMTREILKHEGIRGMFRGLVPTLAREMPGYFFFFGGYECTRYMLTPPGKTKDDLGAFLSYFAYKFETRNL